jgi:hypothetical protein
MNGSRLVCLRMDVLRRWRTALIGHTGCGLPVLEQLETRLDVYVGRIEVSSALIGIQGVGCLVVA